MVCFLQHGFHGSISLNCLLQGPLPNTSPTSLYTRNCLSMICLLPKFLRLSHACVSMVCFQKNGSFPNAEIFKTCQNWLLVKLCRLCRLKVGYFLWNSMTMTMTMIDSNSPPASSMGSISNADLDVLKQGVLGQSHGFKLIRSSIWANKLLNWLRNCETHKFKLTLMWHLQQGKAFPY